MDVDARTRFSATVEDYRRYRPDYPAGLFDWWEADAQLRPGARVLDIGCGTGISTRQLHERGFEVVGVDPNDDMLAAAREESPDAIEYLQGTAEALPVSGPFAAVVGGQCFHWVDPAAAVPSLRAALAPGGRVMAFWNLRDRRDPLMAAYEALLLERCPEYADVGAEPRAKAFIAAASLAEIRTHEVPHRQRFDRTGFLGRVWSSSYVRRSVTDRASFDAALETLFDSHAVDGAVSFVYRTVAWTFS